MTASTPTRMASPEAEALPVGVPSPGADVAWAVEMAGVSRRFGPTIALEDVHLQIRAGEFFSLLGPSGCGKTTLLRVLAGLELPDAGEVRVARRPMAGVPAHQRPVNTVFQSYALFPHLNVRDNVGFGLRMKRLSAEVIGTKVAAALAMVRIEALEDRRPAQLSGGQKQRVALARALVNEPQVLLLDEPLGALDLQLRRQLQGELRALQRRLGITFLHVTHDQEEALAISDRVGVMRGGRLEQIGSPREIYRRPATRFVAEFLGGCNVMAVGRWEGQGPELRAECGLGRLRVAAEGFSADARPAWLAIRPEQIEIGTGQTARDNAVAAIVRSVVYRGAHTELTLEAGGITLCATRLNRGGDIGEPGAGVTLRLPPEALVIVR